MMRVDFSPEEVDKLDHMRHHHSDHRVRRRMEVLYLRSQGYSMETISGITGLCENTLRSYIRQYLHGGIEALLEIHCHRPESELDQHIPAIKARFEQEPPQSIPHAQKMIKDITGLERSLTQIRKLLIRMGLKRLKAGFVPVKGNPEAQQEFLDSTLNPAIDEAQQGSSAVFFMDATHLLWGVVLAYLWCFRRIHAPQPPGRRRFSVLGAVNPFTQEFIAVYTVGSVTTATVCEFLKKIREQCPTIEKIVVFLDNARYQNNDVVKEFAAQQKIELRFLPPYSPNLNLIERVWKYLKKEQLSNKYYLTFEKFCEIIEAFLSQNSQEFRNDLKTLLRPNFRIWPKPDLMPVPKQDSNPAHIPDAA